MLRNYRNATDDFADLRRLADDIGTRSFDDRIGHRDLPDGFDHTAWRHLEDAGLTRLTSDPESGGGPRELALVLRALARHAVTVPLAETDVLAGWLAARAGIEVPDTGPLTVSGRRRGNLGAATVFRTPGDADAVVVALRDGESLRVAVAAPADAGHRLRVQPRRRAARHRRRARRSTS